MRVTQTDFVTNFTDKRDLENFFSKQLSYFLHQRPCVYCTILLLALFSSTCYWGQGRCCLIIYQIIKSILGRAGGVYDELVVKNLSGAIIGEYHKKFVEEK
ncbi:hypothetical protein GLOIN_2v1617799 [Rhizophagus clarus]|uniref:Uncharacterized protein n=1 Tax=Rhizophagus clarus TaxID=94130 RepID=A0A8H3LHA4_9GLOM|nr:hypothetical protein GLOIN_2v1617799 [Rhizophagus clarus]